MEALSPVSDDEREDGEIVDDDFEDISDYSIPSSGKSDYNRGLLRAISLSSISDSDGGERESRDKRYVEYLTLSETRQSKHERRSRRIRIVNLRERKRRRRRSSSSPRFSEDSDSGDGADLRTIEQLNKAVRIDSGSGDDGHHNSLKDRLKCMIQPTSEREVLTVGTLHNGNKATLDESIDKELEELRLQALKSAMLKKHMERKRRKEMQASDMDSPQAISCNNDKENTENNILPNMMPLSSETKACNDQSDALEDDIDIMRAMLLASMSKKITEDQPSSTPSSSPLPPIDSDGVKKTNPSLPIKLPPVKPLIIQVNKDSETEESDVEISLLPPANIPSSVEDFLRKQREEYEAKLAQEKTEQNESAGSLNVSLDKSVLKHLPASQQEEYKKLKQKLLQASKQKLNGVTCAIHKKPPSNSAPKEKKERFQPRGKYKELLPIIKQMKAEAAAKSKCEEVQKQLQKQLQKVGAQINSHNQRYRTLSAQFHASRKAIDLRLAKAAKIAEQARAVPQQKTMHLKKVNVLPNQQVSQQVKPLNSGVKPQPMSSTNTKVGRSLQTNGTVEVKASNVPEGVQKTTVTSAIPELPIPDQNANLHKGSMNNGEIKVPDTAQEPEPLTYVSPLDRRETNRNNNPLQMLCPYELFGVCKDQNCTFNHYP